ncbi:hypothetical protein BGZ60DRAFT_495782 [Tricladium varicosporioides]|nr:hypothetical protein BGZ60DRAFT_495782 [Hymenoscyphus varicosporioides]
MTQPLPITISKSHPKIDTHSHIYPDFYRDAVEAAGWSPGPDGMPGHPKWSVDEHLKFMKVNNITKSILSISSPGSYLIPGDTNSGIAMTRQVNNYMSGLKKQYPDKFGFFASLPLPNIEASLEQIDSVVEMGADGFCIMSNAHGIYAGDPELAPVWEKLNEKKAIVFIHPTCPCPCGMDNRIMGNERLKHVTPLSKDFPASMMEFIFDTTRNVSDLLISGTASRHKNIRWIIPHAGGALPSLLDRVLEVTSLIGLKAGGSRIAENLTYDDIISILNAQFWFDLAGFPGRNLVRQMQGLGIKKGRWTYGSDVPFTNFAFAGKLADRLEEELLKSFGVEELKDVFAGNAAELFGLKEKEAMGIEA